MSLEFLKLKGRNFVLYEDLEIDFRDLEGSVVFVTGKNLDIAGADSNYSGKTLIGDMLTDLLFDKTIRRHSQDSFIGPFSKDCVTSLLVYDSIEKEKYLIKKFRKHPKHGDKVFFIKSSTKKDLSKKTKADTYKVIWKILGINWRTFRNRNYYGQDDYERFLRVTDGKKAEIIIDIQDLEDLKLSKKKAIVLLKDAKKKTDDLNAEVRAHSSSLELIEDAIQVEKEKKAHDLFHIRKKFKKALYALKVSKTVYDSKASASIESDIIVVEKETEEIEADVMKGELLKEQGVKFREQHDRAQSGLTFETKRGNRLDAEILRVKNEAVDLKNRLIATCGKCGAKLTKERTKNTLNSLKTEVKDLLKRKSNSDTLFNEHISDIANLKRKILNCKKALAPLLGSLKKRKTLQDELKTLNGLKFSKETAKRNSAVLEEQAKSIKKEIAEIKLRKTTSISTRNKLKERVKVANDELEKIQQEAEKNEFSKMVFDRTIRNIFNSFLDSLNHYSNSYLDTLCDNDISVSFSPRVERQSKKVVDEINVLVSVGGNDPRNFRTYSGGERGRVELVTQLALFSSSDLNVPFLFLDEPFTGIDAQGRNRMIQLLQKIGEEGNLVMVVSNKTVPQGYGSQLQVTREDGRSSIKIIT